MQSYGTFSRLPLILALALSAANPSRTEAAPGWVTEGREVAKLTALNEILTKAYQEEDVPRLRRLLSDAHVHNNVFGSAMTKETFLRDIESGILVFDTYSTPEIKWHIDGNTAIATGLIEAKAVRDGKPVPALQFRFTRVFTKEDDTWKVLLFHNTMAK